MDLDIEIEDWPTGRWQDLTARAAQAAELVAPELGNERLAVSVLFTSDDEVHELNREWRGRDKPTNVLSFPMLERDELLDLESDGPPVLLGDIALALGVCTGEAETRGVSLEDHAAHLLVHGLLHLAGYDHVDTDAEAAAMELLEIAALAKMGIADPYGDRDTTGV